MKNSRKTNIQYWFTVDGDTEGWYLDHIQRLINNSDDSKYTIKIEHKKYKSPKKYAKNISPCLTPKVTHLCDIESTSQEHLSNFSKVLSELQSAKKDKGIKYDIGYSNYTFDLWIVLHKKQLTAHLSDRFDYLTHINSSYSKDFQSMDEYKERDNFHTILDCINLETVKCAIKNAEKIEKLNEENGANSKSEYGVKYYLDNPSLSIHKAIKQILIDCNIIKKKK